MDAEFVYQSTDSRTFTPERSHDNEKAFVKRWLPRCGQEHGKKHRLGVPLGISDRVKSLPLLSLTAPGGEEETVRQTKERAGSPNKQQGHQKKEAIFREPLLAPATPLFPKKQVDQWPWWRAPEGACFSTSVTLGMGNRHSLSSDQGQMQGPLCRTTQPPGLLLAQPTLCNADNSMVKEWT